MEMNILESTFTKNMVLESERYYKAENKRYDFYLGDTILTSNEEYIAISKANKEPLSAAFFMKDLHDVTLDFGGAELVFHGRIAPFVLDGCQNISIKNCKINYDRPFYTEAKLLEADTSHIRIKISNGFPYRVEEGYLIAQSEYWENRLNEKNLRLQLYDPITHAVAPVEFIFALIGKEIFPHPNLPLPVRQLMAEEDGDEVVLYGEFPASWKAGYDLVITHERRDKNVFTAIGCNDVNVEHVRILHGASMGFVGMHCRNLSFRDFSMYRDEEHPNLVTNNADAIHTFHCSGHILLEDCKMENMLDDSLNVHGNYTIVDECEKNKLYAAIKAFGLSTRFRNYMPGDRIAIYYGTTMNKKAEYTVEAVGVDSDRYLLTLDGDATGIEKGDMIENIGGQADITIRNCTFGLFCGTMRLQSRGKILIENCSYARKGPNILFSGDTTYWYESSPVQDVAIRNCDFQGVIEIAPEMTYSDDARYYHKNIHIENCHFARMDVLHAQYTDEIVFRNNYSDGGKMQVFLKHCGSCEVDENCEIIQLNA